MRNFRNAAIAGATAVALTFGGASVATAQEVPAKQDSSTSSSQENGTTNNGSSNESSSQENNGSSDSSWQARFGELLGNDHGDDAIANGRDLWGKDRKPENNGVAETLRGLSIALGVFAGFTFLIAPIYNFFKFGPFAK